MSLNTSSPIPLYRQLADRLLADIDAGTYGVDAKIPSEHELASQFDIGRPTVRQATDLLVRQGRLERRRGSGTYVRHAESAIDLLSAAGTSSAFLSTSADAKLELISGATLVDKSIYQVQRRALVENTPVFLETLNFDADVFVGLDQLALENRSLSALVKDTYFLEASEMTQTFSVLMADQKLSSQLAIDKNTPLLHIQRAVHFNKNQNALNVDMVCRTDRFEFSQTLHPAQANVTH